MRILLIGAPDSATDTILTALLKDRMTVDLAPSAAQGIEAALSSIYDVIVLLGDGAVLDDVMQLRTDGCATPLLLVLSHAAARERIRLLDAGADDCLARPYVLGELVARVRALGRRASVLTTDVLQAGDLRCDRRCGVLQCGNACVRLSVKELQLLEQFLLNPSQILSRDRLLQRVWGYDCDATYNSLEVYLSFVRKKLSRAGSKVKIRAARGIGYYLEANTSYAQ